MLIIPNKPLFRPDEVAELLNISVRTIYSWIRLGKISAVKIGPFRTIRIKHDQVQEMIVPSDE